MENATTRLIDLISAANANCTDYRVGKLLEVSTSAVSRWRTGVGHMSEANVTQACKLAGIKDVFRWQAFVGAERELGPDGDHWREIRDDFLRIDAGRQPKKDGYLYSLVHGLKGKVASMLLAGLVGVGLGALPAQRVRAAETGDQPQSVYYGKSRRGWRRLRRLKAFVSLPLRKTRWTAARNRSTGLSPSRSWWCSRAATRAPQSAGNGCAAYRIGCSA